MRVLCFQSAFIGVHLRPAMPLLWRFACTCSRMIDVISNRLSQYMDLLSARQKLVASNVANIDTPGYKTKDIDFQFEFMSLAQGGQPNVVEAPGLVIHNDGNNVSLDREMG